MRVIKLVSGEGNGQSTACLMTAASIVNGDKEIGDASPCICPVIRSFIINTNDAMPDRFRSELYTPLIWEIIGTRSNDIKVFVSRARVASKYAAIFADAAANADANANADAAAIAVTAANAANAAYDSAADAAAAAAIAVTAAAVIAAYDYAANAANDSATAADAAAIAVTAAAVRNVWEMCVECVREMIAVDPPPRERGFMEIDQLAERLGSYLVG